MKKKIFSVLFALVLAVSLSLVTATPVAAGPGTEVQITSEAHYDRNPSFVEATVAGGGCTVGDYLVFYVKGQGDLPNVPPTYDPDGDTYDVYYKKSTDKGVTWSAAQQVAVCNTDQRGMAAFQHASTGDIWVFVSGGGAGGTAIKYTTYNGTSWSALTDTTYTGSHVDAFQDSDGKIWVFYEEATGIEAIKSADSGATWNQVTNIGPDPNDGIPKVMQANGKLYVTWCNWNVGGKVWYTHSTDGLTGATWNTPVELADVSGTTMCDSVLLQDSHNKWWLFYAPWDIGTDSQWIEYITSLDGGASWSTATQLTSGGYDTTYWWDMWPEPFEDDNGNIQLLYSSERDGAGTNRIDGNIWLIQVTGVGPVTMTSTVSAALAISVSPTSIDFGIIPPGSESSEVDITVSNIGNISVDISASIIDDTADEFYAHNLFLNDPTKAVNYIESNLAAGANVVPKAKVKVPADYASIGERTGILVFWAEEH